MPRQAAPLCKAPEILDTVLHKIHAASSRGVWGGTHLRRRGITVALQQPVAVEPLLELL